MMELTIIVLVVFNGILLYCYLKNSFKIGYYETRLENRGVDISHIKKMSLWSMLKR